MADQTADSSATSGFGSSVINAVRRVFGGPSRWRALSDGGGSVSSIPGGEHQQDVEGDGKSDLNGNESTMKLPLDDESAVDAALQPDVLCRRCLASKLNDGVTASIDLLAASRYPPPSTTSSTGVCRRCGDRLPPSDASCAVDTCASEQLVVGEPVCACVVCSRTRTRALMRSTSAAAADIDSCSSSSSCSTSSLTADLTSSDVCLMASSAEVNPGRRSGSRRPPAKPRMCHSKTTPTVSSSCAHASSDHASTGNIIIPASRRHQPFMHSSPPSLPPVPDAFMLPPHVAISADGEEGYVRSQRRLARINHRRVADMSASNCVVVPPNRTVRHLTDLDT